MTQCSANMAKFIFTYIMIFIITGITEHTDKTKHSGQGQKKNKNACITMSKNMITKTMTVQGFKQK